MAAGAMSLLTLARDNKADQIRAMVARGVPANLANEFGQTALHIASLWGNVDAIDALIDLGADASIPNSRGQTPLHFAASAKRDPLAACKALLDGGADPDAVDAMGRQPYEMAEDDEVRALLGGPDARIFEYAAAGNAAGLAELFAGAAGEVSLDTPRGKISARVVDSEGRTPLNLAIAAESVDAVKAILQHDPAVKNFPDMEGNTSLHAAASAGNLDILRFLLALEPELNVQNMNPSEYAQGNWALHGEALLSADKSPLHIAVEAGDVELVKVLLHEAKGKLDVSLLDFDKASPLHYALEAGDMDIVEVLLEAGADVNQPHPDFSSPLHLAATRGKPHLLQLLLARGADTGVVGRDDWTPLMLAARAGSADKIAILLGAGADASAANKQGNTALHLAALNGHVAAVRALLAGGASKAAANAEGKTPAQVAKSEEVRGALE